jgi:site-specific DNA-methyltransferase (adenine-specific)/modification methylase
MAVDIETTSFVTLPLDKIVSRLKIRRISARGVKRLVESMRWAGFLENYPLIVVQLEDGTYLLIDGNHRYEAAKELGILLVPCIVKRGLSEAECYQLAIQANNATESSVPPNLIAYAEFVWDRLAEENENGKQKYTQFDVAKMLGWSRERIAQYVMLSKIKKKAWEIIVTSFEQNVTGSEEGGVTKIVTDVTFNENMLRPILDLSEDQQVELVKDLATGKIEKNAFTKLAKAYKARNEIKDYALKQLGNLGETYTNQLLKSIDSGAYDSEWQADKDHKEHPKLGKLIQSIRDEWEQKSSYRLISGDFYEEIQKIADGSIDLVLTDPPYNIARENTFELEGRSNISQDFGEWDKHEDDAFIKMFSTWATQWARVLRSQGSGYVFTSDSYISHLRSALEKAGLHVKATIIWHKSNPGTQVVKTNFKSSVEYILFFTKDKGGHTFNWQGENEMHNFIETPICGGNERLKNARGETLHPTQKPEVLIQHFMNISSNRGDMVLDGFMGVGTTGKVAKSLGRKFIGIEQDKTFYDAAVRRLADD